jgi:hypothetical protein
VTFTPRLGLVVDDLLQVLVEPLALGQQRVELDLASTERRVVCAICDVAASTLSISSTDCVGSMMR